jgi:hypothetical protein
MLKRKTAIAAAIVIFFAIWQSAPIMLCAASHITFRDNFNRSTSAANWEPVNGTWTFQRGKLIGMADPGGDGWIYVASKQFPGDIAIQVLYNETDSTAEIAFNSTGHLENEYRVTIWSKTSSFFPNRWAVQTYKNGFEDGLIPPDATDVADNTIPAPFPIPTSGHFSVRRVDNTITLYVNGRRLGSVTDSDPLPAEGQIGLVVTGDTTTFDNFEVRSVRRGHRFDRHSGAIAGN